MPKAEIALKYPEEIERKQREGHYHYRPPGRENWPDIELRIHSFLGTLSRDCEGLNVLVVIHSNWMVVFQRLVHRFSIDEALRRYSEKCLCHYLSRGDYRWQIAPSTRGREHSAVERATVSLIDFSHTIIHGQTTKGLPL